MLYNQVQIYNLASAASWCGFMKHLAGFLGERAIIDVLNGYLDWIDGHHKRLIVEIVESNHIKVYWGIQRSRDLTIDWTKTGWKTKAKYQLYIKI